MITFLCLHLSSMRSAHSSRLLASCREKYNSWMCPVLLAASKDNKAWQDLQDPQSVLSRTNIVQALLADPLPGESA